MENKRTTPPSLRKFNALQNENKQLKQSVEFLTASNQEYRKQLNPDKIDLNLSELGELMMNLVFRANYTVEDLNREFKDSILAIERGLIINENENN
jgi:hypothetical protein